MQVQRQEVLEDLVSAPRMTLDKYLANHFPTKASPGVCIGAHEWLAPPSLITMDYLASLGFGLRV